MEIPILKIPFSHNDVDFISRHLSQMLLEGQLAMGRHNKCFEDKFAEFCQSPMALACANGTAALELICRALNLEGASVAIPANTFMATAMAPIAAGARIILVDCDPVHFQMCPDDLARKMRPDTRAVIVVHIGGFISPQLQRLQMIAAENNAAFIEDAAHAHGAELKQGRAGTLGLAAAFSFFPTKVLTCGEGGMVTTADKNLYEKMRAIRQHGQLTPGENIHQMFGLNYRPSEIHALLGLVMMEKAEWILERRRKGAGIYDELLQGSALQAVLAPEGQKPAYYKYMALLPRGVNRSLLKQRLRDEFKVNLTGEVYVLGLHRQPVWKANPQYLASEPGSLPNTDMVNQRQVCLPLYPGLSAEAQAYVVEKILKVMENIHYDKE